MACYIVGFPPFSPYNLDVNLTLRCQQSASGTAPSVVSGTAVSTAGLTEWQVIAHEIGHNFGAIVRRLPFEKSFSD